MAVNLLVDMIASDTARKSVLMLIYHLHQRDVVIADCGYTYQQHVGIMVEELKTPLFTKGVKQLQKINVDWSRELQIVHIHIERIIGGTLILRQSQ
uniref:DDE Tnp4 domain-containing protein n=1 Tax=Amphimedon queenslandica TaxID=400682 RepID=A0A1X7UBU8_AMPQE